MTTLDLSQLTRERLMAWRNLHQQAVQLAHEYGRRSVKDEESLRRIDAELAMRDRYPRDLHNSTEPS
ncbi:hypothetical protein XM25_20055 [Devosia sp. H5989]|nr:hypothetical protein XM25_20055 [Devosia sp. H5989]